MTPWQVAVLTYLGITLMIAFWVGIEWTDQRRYQKQFDETGYASSFYSEEKLRQSARSVLLAPLWPFLLIGLIGKTIGSAVGHLLIDARKKK